MGRTPKMFTVTVKDELKYLSKVSIFWTYSCYHSYNWKTCKECHDCFYSCYYYSFGFWLAFLFSSSCFFKRETQWEGTIWKEEKVIAFSWGATMGDCPFSATLWTQFSERWQCRRIERTQSTEQERNPVLQSGERTFLRVEASPVLQAETNQFPYCVIQIGI